MQSWNDYEAVTRPGHVWRRDMSLSRVVKLNIALYLSASGLVMLGQYTELSTRVEGLAQYRWNQLLSAVLNGAGMSEVDVMSHDH